VHVPDGGVVVSVTLMTPTTVEERRRAMRRIGFVALALATATACIFDQSDYQGGGRLDQGATANQVDTTQPSATDTGSSSSSASSSASTAAPDASPPADAATDGG
jgi:hypothetical protein